jgi:hypothetical protein
MTPAPPETTVVGVMVLPYVTVLVGTKAEGPETTPPPQQFADLAVDADAAAAGAMTAIPTHAEVMRRRRIIFVFPPKGNRGSVWNLNAPSARGYST